MRIKPAWFGLLLLVLIPASQAAVVRGNTLSDEELAQEVYQRISHAWGGDTASLAVATQGGLVVLTGEAPSPPLARQATDIAEATPGVVEVVNRLQSRSR